MKIERQFSECTEILIPKAICMPARQSTYVTEQNLI